MLKLNYLLLAKSIATDSNTNQLSIFNIIEDLYSTQLPSMIGECVLLGLLEKDEKEPDIIKVQVVYKNNQQVSTQDVDVNFSGLSRARSMITLAMVPLLEYGEISFEYKYKGKTLGKLIIPHHKGPKPGFKELTGKITSS